MSVQCQHALKERSIKMSENKNTGGAKKFFTSKLFKWILIIILEFVSIFILGKVASASGGELLSKPFLIYYAVCIVLSLGVIGSMGRSRKAAERAQHKGTIRIMTERQYNYEKQDKAAGHAAFLVVASLIVAPFAAPVSLGNVIHKALCMILK